MSGWCPRHVWMMPKTSMNDAQYIYERCPKHLWMMPNACMNDAQYIYEWYPIHLWLMPNTSMNDAQYIYEWYPIHLGMMPNTSMNDSQTCLDDAQVMSGWCPIHLWMIPNTSMNDAQYIYEWCPIHLWLMPNALLGVLHRTRLRKGSHFEEHFESTLQGRFVDPRLKLSGELIKRSALGLVAIYNLLPEACRMEASVKTFQARLQGLLKQRAAAGCRDWMATFSPRLPLQQHPLAWFFVRLESGLRRDRRRHKNLFWAKMLLTLTNADVWDVIVRLSVG